MTAETWVATETTPEQPLPETKYEVKDTVVVRSVTKSSLNSRIESLNNDIARLEEEKAKAQADLDKITELEKE